MSSDEEAPVLSRKILALLGALAAAGLLMFAYSGFRTPVWNSSGARDPGGPASQEIAIGSWSEPGTIFPTLTKSAWETMVATQLFAPLLQLSADLELLPGVAADWSWDEETLTYTFHLREDVYFHDGKQLTAEDVIWTLQYPLHPDYPGPWFDLYKNIRGALEYHRGEAGSVTGLQAPDPFTVQVQLLQPDAAALLAIGLTGIMPRHVYEPYTNEHGVAALYDSFRHMPPVGSGPFRLADWEPGTRMVLVRHEGAGQLLARSGEIRIEFFPGPTDMFEALQDGRIDIAAGLSPDQFQMALEHPDLQAYQHPWLSYDALVFNLDKPPFDDVRVRRALAHAVDRLRLVDVFLGGLGSPATGLHSHPIMWHFSDEADAAYPGYDPEQAIKLMEAAGWTIDKDGDGKIIPGAVWTKDGKRLGFRLTSGDDLRHRRIQQFLQRSWLQLGFAVELEEVDTDVLFSQLLPGDDWDTALVSVGSSIEPALTLPLLFGCLHVSIADSWNWPGYCSAGGVPGEAPGVLEQLVDQARQNMRDQEARATIYRQINEILATDLPYLWLVYPDGLMAARSDVGGVDPVHPVNFGFDVWRYQRRQ